jgi:hypothetical protein
VGHENPGHEDSNRGLRPFTERLTGPLNGDVCFPRPISDSRQSYDLPVRFIIRDSGIPMPVLLAKTKRATLTWKIARLSTPSRRYRSMLFLYASNPLIENPLGQRLGSANRQITVTSLLRESPTLRLTRLRVRTFWCPSRGLDSHSSISDDQPDRTACARD